MIKQTVATILMAGLALNISADSVEVAKPKVKASELLRQFGKKAQSSKTVYLRFKCQAIHLKRDKQNPPYVTELWQDYTKDWLRLSGGKRGKKEVMMVNKDGFFSWREKSDELVGDIRKGGRERYLPNEKTINLFNTGPNEFVLQGVKGYSALLNSFKISYDKVSSKDESVIWFSLVPKDDLPDREIYGNEGIIKIGVNKDNGIVVGFVWGDKRRIVKSEAIEIKLNEKFDDKLFIAPVKK